MKRIHAVSTLILSFCLTLSAQEPPEIRSPEINTASPEGQLLAQAGMAETVAERIPILEKVAQEFPDTPLRGYVLFQLQSAYLEQKQHDKVAEVGQQLLEIVPNDLEVRHNVNQALFNAGRYDDLAEPLAETKPMAEAQAAAEAPPDDEAAAFAKQYAEGVVQWLEWATNASMTQQTDPLKKVQWMDLLRERYPDSQYSQNLENNYVMAYQQAGDQAKTLEWMEKAVEAGQGDEAYLYNMAESVYGTDRAKSREYAERMLAMLEATGEGPREGMTAEQWTAHKDKHAAYAEFVIGRTHVAENTKAAYRTGRSHLLKSVDFLKAEGGQRYHLLSYFLGVCYVQLDIQGDNIKQATYWMGQAASTDGQFKAQAAETLKKIKAM